MTDLNPPHFTGQDSPGPDHQDHEAVAIRAYEIWQRRGCPEGSAAQDWFDAETELRNERRARLEATRLFEPPTPLEIVPAMAADGAGGATAEGASADAPAKRRRRAPAAAKSGAGEAAGIAAAAAAAATSGGTRVARKRPARPDA